MAEELHVSLRDIDRRAIQALACCRFPPGSYPKRLAQDLAARLRADPALELTMKQLAALWRACWHFRRQITENTVLAEAARWHEAEQEERERASAMVKPKIVCLCGSTRFYVHFQ